MRVHIDESGRDNLAGRVIHLRPIGAQICADRANHTVLDENVTDFISLCGGIDHPTAFQQQCPHQAFPPIRINVKSAMRMATPFFTSSCMRDCTP